MSQTLKLDISNFFKNCVGKVNGQSPFQCIRCDIDDLAVFVCLCLISHNYGIKIFRDIEEFVVVLFPDSGRETVRNRHSN